MFPKLSIKSSSFLTINLLIKIFIVATLFELKAVNCQTNEITTTETSTNIIINNTTLLPLKTPQEKGIDVDGNVDAGSKDIEVIENDLTINQILTNLSIFNNDDSHEYDTALVLMLENVTHTCLERCMEEVSVK